MESLDQCFIEIKNYVSVRTKKGIENKLENITVDLNKSIGLSHFKYCVQGWVWSFQKRYDRTGRST